MSLHRNILDSNLHAELKMLTEKFFASAAMLQKDPDRVEKHSLNKSINRYIDQTLLKPEATLSQVLELCTGAKKHNFKAVCIQPCNIQKTAEALDGTETLPITVIGFPLGANTTATKVFETQNAIQLGAKEIDMVINISALKSGNYALVYQDIASVVKAAGNIPVKVIVETAYLTVEEKIFLCACVQDAKASYIKTSTGFAPTHAKLEDIQLFKYLLNDKVKIKASGGIKNFDQAKAFIEAGADRIGTSSGVDIMSGTTNESSGY